MQIVKITYNLAGTVSISELYLASSVWISFVPDVSRAQTFEFFMNRSANRMHGLLKLQYRCCEYKAATRVERLEFSP